MKFRIYEDKIPGGKADGASPKEFDKDQLIKGVSHEMEHTNDPDKALEIAMDHLKENPRYYDDLQKIEKEGIDPLKLMQLLEPIKSKVNIKDKKAEMYVSALEDLLQITAKTSPISDKQIKNKLKMLGTSMGGFSQKLAIDEPEDETSVELPKSWGPEPEKKWGNFSGDYYPERPVGKLPAKSTPSSMPSLAKVAKDPETPKASMPSVSPLKFEPKPFSWKDYKGPEDEEETSPSSTSSAPYKIRYVNEPESSKSKSEPSTYSYSKSQAAAKSKAPSVAKKPVSKKPEPKKSEPKKVEPKAKTPPPAVKKAEPKKKASPVVAKKDEPKKPELAKVSAPSKVAVAKKPQQVKKVDDKQKKSDVPASKGKDEEVFKKLKAMDKAFYKAVSDGMDAKAAEQFAKKSWKKFVESLNKAK